MVNLINLKKCVSNLELDLRYATTNNFTGKKLYPKPVCLLHKKVAIAFKQASEQLQERGLHFIIYDAYRPPAVQNILCAHFADENFVAKVSNHSRGIALDLTLADNNGPLEMPSEFDCFDKKAHPHFQGCSRNARENRDFLIALMKRHGFEVDKNEWWHFDFVSLRDSPIIDVDLSLI